MADKGQGVQMDRIMKDVVAPPMFPLTCADALDDKKMPKLDVLKEHLLREGRLADDLSEYLVNEATNLFHQEPNMLELQYPITGTSLDHTRMCVHRTKCDQEERHLKCATLCYSKDMYTEIDVDAVVANTIDSRTFTCLPLPVQVACFHMSPLYTNQVHRHS